MSHFDEKKACRASITCMRPCPRLSTGLPSPLSPLPTVSLPVVHQRKQFGDRFIYLSIARVPSNSHSLLTLTGYICPSSTISPPAPPPQSPPPPPPTASRRLSSSPAALGQRRLPQLRRPLPSVSQGQRGRGAPLQLQVPRSL